MSSLLLFYEAITMTFVISFLLSCWAMSFILSHSFMSWRLGLRMYSAGFVIKALTFLSKRRPIANVLRAVRHKSPESSVSFRSTFCNPSTSERDILRIRSIQHCATIAFAFTNIPYFAVKVNTLYHSLTFFGWIIQDYLPLIVHNHMIMCESYKSVKGFLEVILTFITQWELILLWLLPNI